MKWGKVQLGNIANIISGYAWSAPKFKEKGKIPIIRIQNLGGNKDEKFVYWDEEYDERFIITPGDMLLSLSGSIKVNIWEGRKALLNQRILKISATENINKKWLYWYLSSQLQRIESAGKHALVNNVSVTDIRNWEVPLPPLPIQQQIADTLDKAEALRRKDHELLDKYDELAKAVFYEMFGDPVRNEKGWPLKTIQQLVTKSRHSIKRGPFGGALKKEIFVDKGYLVFEQYHALNNDFSFERYFINEEKYKELIAFNVDPGDIIISCSGVYLGKLAEVPDGVKKGIINQALLKVSLDQSLYKNDFFITVFSNPNFKEKYFASERGAAIPNFPPMSVFKEFKFIFPPMNLQEKYMQIIKNIKLSKNNLDDQPLLFDALLNKYFS